MLSSQTKITPIKFSRASAEIVIVVLGILIAFGLDSWWDSRKSLEWEHGQLELLREEAQSNIEHIAAVIEAHEQTAADVQAILVFATQTPPNETSIFRNGVVTSLIGWRTSEISTGALDALLASGDLGGLSNPQLRQSLTAWKALVLDAQEKENLARDFIEYILTPALVEEDFIAPAYEARPPYGDSDDLVNRSVAVRSSAKLGGLSAARLGHIRLAIHSQNTVVEELRKIVVLIDSELAH